MKREDCRYQAFYCEENIWQLCQDPYFKGLELLVCLITNRIRSCAFLAQRAGLPESGLVTWDYHAVLFTKENKTWMVFDLDTLLGFPSPLAEYLDRTFSPSFPEPYQAIFRLVDASRYQEEFCSDRSHMLNGVNEYHAPVPSWGAPDAGEGGTNLAELIDLQDQKWGKLYNLSELRQTLLG